MDSLRIDTGEKRIAINDDPNRVVVFNPEDRLFVDKFYNLLPEIQTQARVFEDREKEIVDKSEIDDFGVPSNLQDLIDLQKEVCVYMRGRIDYVFGEGTSQIAFGNVLSPSVIIQFLEGISPFIEKVRSEKINKYTKSYTRSGKKVMK